MSNQLAARLDELSRERARLRESIRLIGQTFASNLDRPALHVSAAAASDALVQCREAREAFPINEKGIVRLTYLLMSLPPAG